MIRQISICVLLTGLTSLLALNVSKEQLCRDYAQCRIEARYQFEKCAGGFMQMILAKHANIDAKYPGDNHIDKQTMWRHCENEMSLNISHDMHSLYERIDNFAMQCTLNTNPESAHIDAYYMLSCKAIQREIGKNASAAFSRAKSKEECSQIYESEILRCELSKDCCPQFDQCRNRMEIESGFRLKENILSSHFEKCIKESLVKSNIITLAKSNYLENGTAANFDPIHTENSTATFDATSSTNSDTTTTTLPSTQSILPLILPSPSEALNKLANRLFPHLNRQNESNSSSNSTIEQNSQSLINLTVAQTDQMNATDVTESLSKSVTESISQSWTESPKNRTEVRWSIDLINQPQITIDQTISNALEPNPNSAETNSPDDPQIRRAPSQERNPLISSYKEKITVNNIFCSQYFECIEVMNQQRLYCEDKYMEDADKYGIDDWNLRVIFEQNSQVNDENIKRTCLKTVDITTQKKLISLRSVMDHYKKECTMRGSETSGLTSDEFQRCGSIKPLSILSTVGQDEKTGRGRKRGLAHRCITKLGKLHGKCEELRSCCPKSADCEQPKRGLEAKRYSIIVDKLKEEQRQCETQQLKVLTDAAN
ncbi:hypothetical protein DdX_05758 [Ditylenchus destructor]|uniref:Uncharacterized protein n=1 Tax=Ditylenchus destructor TaxID=166010 RepID=A0AAD4R3P1_9BILA|nr:hypothetical protein DdX_05758 [Ditylenchus destructor]